ncbi:thioredoxin domain-containing protein [Sunxiuqinia elliptica]|uniref:Thioredoxin n=1 Tax=Sunxiuqinia elliptica TaxID=655355 RepID=A0A4R6HBY5_9BACT|nr:thioredoxin domain-containing protein [Sunxiuqinia elliptica]TDO05281.1 thioredoxin [Sunxiuqinia elliptica]TDO64830.1 thioredoxin [Sunxiuqinia elliptica]
MRKLLAMIALAAITTAGCANGNTSENKESSKKTTVAQDKDGGTTLISKDQFLSNVWNYQDSPDEWKFLGDKPAIIDFYADWCGPCRIASPILDEVSQEYAGKVDVYKIDTQKERELASVFGIQSIPAFLYIPLEGKPLMMAGIGRSNAETKQMFVDNIKKYLLTEK